MKDGLKEGLMREREVLLLGDDEIDGKQLR